MRFVTWAQPFTNTALFMFAVGLCVGLTTPTLPPSTKGTPCLTRGTPCLTRRAALASTTGALVLPLRVGAAVTETEREVMTTVQVPMGKGKPAFAVNKPRYTGAGDPAWTYQKRDISKAVYRADWPAAWPYTPKDFVRMDEEPDPVLPPCECGVHISTRMV